MQNNYSNTFPSEYHYIDNPEDNIFSENPNVLPPMPESDNNSDDGDSIADSITDEMLSSEQSAGFGVRLFAYLIDNVLVFIGLLFFRIILFILTHLGGLDFLSNEILFQYSVNDIFLYILRSAYFVFMTYFTGATLGKHLLKIHVISANPKEHYSFFDILYRETIGRFLSKIILYIGYFMAAVNRNKTALHDILSDTRVTYKKNID